METERAGADVTEVEVVPGMVGAVSRAVGASGC